MEHQSTPPSPVYSSQSTEDDIVHGPTFRGPDVTYLKTPCAIAKIVAAVSETIVDT